MSSIKKRNEDLFVYVKNIILTYCPYSDDRLSILENANSPQMDIEINISNNQSQVRFLFGNKNFKQGIEEQLNISYIIDFETIEEIINFILEDHEFIKYINLYNNTIELNFAINWTDKSIKGINCGDIGLNLIFNNNIELGNKYLYLLFQKYYTILKHTPSFKKLKNEYINNIKKSYFNNLDKEQLISILNSMNENELKELLYNLDNDVFIKYIIDSLQQTKVKNISRKRNID